MLTLIVWIVITIPLIAGVAAVGAFVLAHWDIGFTIVPEEEIVTGIRARRFHKSILFSQTYKILDSARAVAEYNRYHLVNPLTTILHLGANKGGKDDVETGGRRAKIWDVVPLEPGEKPQGNWFEKMLGIRWLGIPILVRVYKYQFRWGTMKQREARSQVADASASNEPVYRDQVVRTLYIKKYVYVSVLRGAETSEGLNVDVLYFFVIMPVNPYDVEFNVDNWLDSTFTEADSWGRSFIGKNTYQQLLSDNDTKNREFFDALEDARRGIMEKFSIRIIHAGIISIEPPADYRETTLLAYTAKQKADAAIATATGQKESTILVADGEAHAIAAKGTAQATSIAAQIAAYAANPEAAQAVLGAEVGKAMAAGPNKTIIGVPSNFLQPGTILGAADSFLGKKPEENK